MKLLWEGGGWRIYEQGCIFAESDNSRAWYKLQARHPEAEDDWVTVASLGELQQVTGMTLEESLAQGLVRVR